MQPSHGPSLLLPPPSLQVPGHALGACKEAISKATADALLAYRTHCAAASSSGQLILPEALKLLPLYSLALSKSTVFRNDVRPDVRAAAMWHLLSLPAHKAVPFIYPRFVALHTLLDRPAVSVRCRGCWAWQGEVASSCASAAWPGHWWCCTRRLGSLIAGARLPVTASTVWPAAPTTVGVVPNRFHPHPPSAQNALPVPDKLWLSAEKLDPEGVFLLENGQEAFIYVGKAAAQGTLQALFGEQPLLCAHPRAQGWDC